MGINGTDKESSYRSEYEREYMLGLNMRRMDSLIDDEWSLGHTALRNAMIELQNAGEGTKEWAEAATRLKRGINAYLESPMAMHTQELTQINEVLEREAVYAARGLDGDDAMKSMGEEECRAELSAVGSRLEAIDTLEEQMQDAQERLAEYSGILEDTETYGWKGDEYKKLRDGIHAFLRADVSMTADEIGEAARSLNESAEAFRQNTDAPEAKELAGFTADLARRIEGSRRVLGGKTPLDEMQGALDARMEELSESMERIRAKDTAKTGSRRKVSLTDLREKEDAGKTRRREINRDHGRPLQDAKRTREGYMGKG